MPAKRVAIDIGSQTIKVIEGIANQGSFDIRRISLAGNPVADVRPGPGSDEQLSLGLFLRDYLRRLEVKSRLCVSSVAGEEVLLHYFDIPEIPPEEIQSLVEVELAEVFPQGWSNLEYDYQVITHGEKKTVLLAGYPKKRCDFLVQAFSQAGLRLVVMDVDSLALANLMFFTGKFQGGTGLTINVGAKVTNMTLVEENGFLLARDIPFGGSVISQELSRRSQFSLVEVENLKKNPGERTVSVITRELASDMVTEVVTAVRYFTSRTSRQVQKFFLCGGSAPLPGLKESLEEGLKIPGEIWNPLAGVPGIPLEVETKGYTFAVALGLLVRRFP
ncbi:MAG: pilus assembly protein PilM [Candidatus Omnitrophica bacterium]|nr:pilus assembly protein PilM [Candidatus Omnitrophota bacterium]